MAYLSAKYVERFRCVGQACGSACCRGWSVQLTREDRDRVTQALASGPSPLRPITEEIVAAPAGMASKTHPYVIQFDQSGACPFVTDDHRCQIHATIGEASLPNVCAQYPREYARIGDQDELWASLSCPEAARLCLLDADGADLVELPQANSQRYLNASIDIDAQTPDYLAYLGEIRGFVFDLLSQRDFALRSRLFFVAYFSHRVGGYFYAQARQVDRQRLKQDMQLLGKRRTLEELASQLDSFSISGAYALGLVDAVISARDGLSKYPDPLPSDALGHAGGRSAICIPDETLVTDPGLQRWLDYSVRRARWETDFRSLLDQAFENYCKLFWMKEWYVDSPNLMAHATACMLRVAILRCRLFSHPSLDTTATDMTLAGRQTLLERALLSVVTEMVRAIEHDRPFQQNLTEALARRGMQDLAHASMLLVV